MTSTPHHPDRSTAAWQQLDRQHYLHPFTDFKQLAAKGTRVIVKAEGVYLYDSDGQRILDGMAGLWCVNLGYGRRELAEAAFRQMLELPYYNSFFQTAHPPAIELAKQLVDLTPPQFNHVFFTGSGSEGNDTVVRLVRRYWDLLGQPDRKVIISRQNAYHGSTMAGASLGGMAIHARAGRPADPGHRPHRAAVLVRRRRRPVAGGVRPEGRPRRWKRRSWSSARNRVAAFIGEPIQGAGGVIIPPDSYWPEIQRICDRYGDPAGGRRGHLRLRPHRPLVRVRALRHPAGPDDDRQGPVVRATCRSAA